MTYEEILSIIAELDYQGNGVINYSEFLGATLDMDKFLTYERLIAVFQQFNTEGSDLMSRKSIVNSMQRFGHELSSLEVIEMLQKQHDIRIFLGIGLEEFDDLIKK